MPRTTSANSPLAEVRQALQTGDLSHAEEILRTIAQTPEQAHSPKACTYWGLLSSQRGDDAQAIRWFERTLVLDPINVQALVNLGELKRRQGDAHTAVTLLVRALDEQPEHIDALANLGIARIDCGDAEGAQAPLRQALRLQPSHLNAASSLARALQDLGELEQACKVLEASERFHPGHPQLIGNRGLLMAALGQPAAALRLYAYSLAGKHDQPALLFARGNAEAALGLLEQANTSFQRAVELQPHDPKALCNRGTVLVQLGRMQEAQACLEQAIAQQPAYPAAWLNLSIALFHSGTVDKAWEAYEQRWHTSSPPILSAEPAIPRWPGNQPWQGAELLLVGEQGLGDSLQFLRCAPLLAKEGARVSLCIPAKLHQLVAQSRLGVEVITREQAMQRRSGYWLPLLSAAGQLQLHGQQPSGSMPYLHAAPERALHWRQQFVADNPNERLLVLGVHWQGNPDTEVNNLSGRSFQLQILAPLAQLPNVRLVSLQKGAGSEQLEHCSFRDRFVACQAEVSDCWDFAECAAITAACDLVISNDSACVHLAGALGIRTWLLLHHVPDWRWGLSGDSTAWYPSMRLFRQPRRGDWGSVIQAVRAALSGGSAIGTPPRHAEDWQRLHQAEQALSTGQLEDAIRCCDALLAEGVRTPTLLSYRALAAGLSGDLEASRLWLKQALSLEPNHLPSLVNLGETERRLGRLEQAVRWLEHAIALDAQHSDGLENLGVALEAQQQSSEAENQLLKAATLYPHNAVYQYNLAAAYKKRGDLESALRRYRQAIALDPQHGDSNFNLALILLLQGNYQEGWQHYEWRLTTRKLLPSHLVAGLPRWTPIHQQANTRLVIVAEQGLGDTLQFLRYLPYAKALAPEIRFYLPQKLYGLAQATQLDVELIAEEEAAPATDGCWLPLLSLAAALGVTPEQPIHTAPYLHANPARTTYWREAFRHQLDPHTIVIGVHWQGNSKAEVNDLEGRSFPLEALEPIAQLPHVRLVSLQKGEGSEQLEHCTFADRWVDCQPQVSACWDFEECAAITAACDLVISNDSAAIHLAGALGVRSWLLLHHVPDWRWGLETDRSFWYPSLRLFRQARRGDWPGVIKAVGRALTELQADRLLQRGARTEAEQLLRLRLKQGGAGAWVSGNLAALCGERGDYEAVVAICRAGLQDHPRSVALHGNLGEALARMGDSSGALQHLQQAWQLEPSSPTAWRNLALHHERNGEPLNAVAVIETALQQQLEGPASQEQRCWLGRCYYQASRQEADAGALEQAQQLAEQAWAADPGQEELLDWLSWLALQCHEPANAVRWVEQAIASGVPTAAQWFRLGLAHRQLGELERAEQAYRQALELAPDHTDAAANLSLLLLLRGAYQEGFMLREARFHKSNLVVPVATPQLPRWQGERQTNLLVVAEQGIGDVWQYVRYLPALQERVSNLQVCVPEHLMGLIRASGLCHNLVNPEQAQAIQEGHWLPMGSIPLALVVTPEQPMVSGAPYLKAAPERIEAWRQRLRQGMSTTSWLVGVNWQGNPAAERMNLRGRSWPLEHLSAIAALPWIQLVSLQKGAGSEQLESCSFRQLFVAEQAAVSACLNFEDCAAITAACDLVISSDTQAAHLAGGLGMNTWLTLQHIPDWRWGLTGENTFWYPSMRLFRQPEPGDWDTVFEQIIEALLAERNGRGIQRRA